MNVGTIREIKNNENRVGLTPKIIQRLVGIGSNVYVEQGAGVNAGFTDFEYRNAGAVVLDTPEKVVRNADLLVKVKEPLESEYPLLSLMKEKILFTYLHLAACDRSLTQALIDNKITAIAYETIEKDGSLPLLAPMSEIAGVLAVQYGAQYLQKKYGGGGVSLGMITGTPSATVVVVGGGVVGAKSAATAAGMGVKVTIIEKDPGRIDGLKREFKEILGEPLASNIRFSESVTNDIVSEADLLIGAVLVVGAKAPCVVTEEHVKNMKNGAVIVDVAIDQGGCVFGSKPTTHENPIYTENGVIYCCITNMPGQVALQSTQALTAATYPYIENLAKNNMKALQCGFENGVNVFKGNVVNKAVAEALGFEYVEFLC